MKKTGVKKLVALALALVMAASLAACGTGGTQTPSTGDPQKPSTGDQQTPSSTGDAGISADSPYAGKGFDLSEHKTVVAYVLGDAPADMDKILEKANKEYFEPWLNTTLQLNFLAWGEASTKYSLLLSGGDTVDLLYAADWMGYTSQAANGGFMELTPDFLQKTLVYSYADQSETSWKQVSIDNKIYAIPASGSEFNSYNMVVMRKDLMDKYNISEPLDSWDKLKSALITISQNEEGVYGIGQRNHDELLWLWWQANNIWYIDQSAAVIYHTHGTEDLPDWDKDVEYLYTSDAFYQYCKQMNELAAAGVWDPNVINDSTPASQLFESGRLACMSWNASINSSGKKMEEAGIGTYAIYDVTPSVKAERAKATNNMFTISSKCKDPERAALLLDCMRGFPEVNNLLQGGIEGEHYILRDDGYREAGPNAASYGWSAWAWGINRADSPKLYDPDPRQLQFLETCEGKEYAPLASGFSFNPGPVETEMAIINDVIGTYSANLMLGMYGDDLDAKYQEFVSQLKAAGIDTVMAECKRQFEEYCANL